MVNNNNSGGLLAGSCLTNSNILTIICTFLQNNGGNYLEIGVYDGQTLCHVAHQNPSKTIYGIDPFISDGNTGQIRGISLTAQEENCMRNV